MIAPGQMLRRYSRRSAIPIESTWRARVFVWTIGVVLLVPIVVLVGLALNKSPYLLFPPAELSTRWIRDVIASDAWRQAFRQSLIVAGFSAPLAVLLATCGAIGLRAARRPRVWQTLFLLPLIVPTVVTALALYPVYVRFGLLGSTFGLVLAHAVLALPYAFLAIWGAIHALDARLELAAASLGANRLQVLRRVVLPLLAPAMLAGGVIAVVVSFDEVVVTLFLSSPATRTVPVVLWTFLRESINPEVPAASLMIMLFNLLLLGLTMLIVRLATRRLAPKR
jgi:putative spermidine/putrescine transport system permease protein